MLGLWVCMVPYCDILHLFPVCPAEGSRPHRIIKCPMSLILCFCVCMCAQSCWNTYRLYMPVCYVWAYVHLNMCGASLMWLCSVICCDLITGSFSTAHDKAVNDSCSSSVPCLSLCLLCNVSTAQWDGSVNDVHIKEGSHQHQSANNDRQTGLDITHMSPF